MKAKTFILETTHDRDRCHKFIDMQPKEPLLRVEIKEHKESRTNAQNRLQWLWHTEGGNHLGYSKDEMYRQFKGRHVAPIFIRDDEGYREMIEAIKVIKTKGMIQQYRALKEQIIDLTRTSDMDTKQFSEALDEYERWLISKGAEITHPEGDYELAMGKSQKP